MKSSREVFLLVIVFLCGLAGFSVYKYARIGRDLSRQEAETAKLRNSNNEIELNLNKQIITARRLRREKQALRQQIGVQRRELDHLHKELIRTKDELVPLRGKISKLADDNRALREKEKDLRLRLEKAARERQALRQKLSSVEALEQAIKALKARQSAKKKTKISFPFKVVIPKPLPNKIAALKKRSGNKGYLVYQGRPTYKAGLSIKVLPAQRQ